MVVGSPMLFDPQARPITSGIESRIPAIAAFRFVTDYLRLLGHDLAEVCSGKP
jgi:hypothetical protein